MRRASRILPALAILLLAGIVAFRLATPSPPPAGSGSRAGSTPRSAPPAGETVPADALRSLRPPDPSKTPLVSASDAPDAPTVPRTPELDRLAHLAGRQIGARLRVVLDPEAYLRGEAAGALERLEVSPETIETLLDLLASDDPRARRDAAIRLSAAMLRPEDLPRLRAALEAELLGGTPDRVSRHAALAMAFALGAQGDRGGAARLERAVLGGERTDDAAFRREATIVIGMLGDGQSSPALREILRIDPDREVRAHAAQGLGRIGGDENRGALAESLARDGEAEVRAWSALGYGAVAATDGTEAGPLRDAAGRDAEPVVRAAAWYSLSRTGGPGTESVLVDAFYADAEPMPRIGAIAGLTEREDPDSAAREFVRTEGVAWLAETARTSENHVELFFAARTLGRIPGETAHGGILAVVDGDAPDWVRTEAVRRLARHDEERAVAELEQRVATEGREAVRRVMTGELRRLTPEPVESHADPSNQ